MGRSSIGNETFVGIAVFAGLGFAIVTGSTSGIMILVEAGHVQEHVSEVSRY